MEALGVKVSGEQAEVPAGGDFQPSGFIAPVMAAMFWTLSSEDNYKKYNESVGDDDQVPTPQYLQPMGQWGYRYYYKSKADALKATELIGSENEQGKKIAPEMRWHLEIKRDRILNWSSDENRLKWPEIMSNDVRVKTMASRKYRHEYQLITLPIAVQAAALYLGMIDRPVFSYDELLDQNTVYDDRFFELMYGHPDAKKAERDEFDEFVKELMDREGLEQRAAIVSVREKGLAKVPYVYSIAYERRTALWAALGENDPEKSLPIARGENGQVLPESEQPKGATTSPLLDFCIKFATSAWETPVWCRAMYLNNPKVDEVFETDSGDRRRNIVALAEIFADESAARAAIESESSEDAVSAAPKIAVPTVPVAWKAAGFTPETFAAQVSQHNGKPAADAAAELQCTVDDVEAFRSWIASRSK